MTSPSTKTAPVLVVDDEEVIATALGEILRQAQYDVVSLSEPTQALEEIKKREFSVIIADQRMPGLSGLDLLAEARRLQPNGTRILITGVLNLDTVIEAINRGEIFRFIVKPWLREEFLATVANGRHRYELLCQNAWLQAETQAINQQLEQANRLLEEKIRTVAEQNLQLGELNQVLGESYTRSLDLCVRTLEAFHPSLGAQTRCVAKVCQAVAAMLELKAEEARTLESAARLYDIGLVGLPRALIRRWQRTPEELDAAERQLIEQHPVLGEALAAFGSGLEQVGGIIRAHHERFDGKGYPDQRRGEEIPWLARLLTAAVAYSSSERAPAQALQEVQVGSGSAFDPEAVRVLLRAVPMTGLPSKQREVTFKDLVPGMILAQGIYSQNGLLLIPEGQRLDESYIEKLVAQNRNLPLGQSLRVYC